MMELTRRLLRLRFCLLYLYLTLIFSVFAVFLLFFIQFKPKSPVFAPNLSLFTGQRESYIFEGGGVDNTRNDVSIGSSRPGGNGLGRGESNIHEVLPIHFSNLGMVKKKEKRSATGACNSDATSISEGIIPKLLVGRARYDNKRILRIFDFFRLGNQWESLLSQFDICLATQSSLERLYWLPEVLRNWRGPLSVAVYITSDEEWLNFNLYLKYLERCFPSFHDQVALHLASPAHTGAFCVDPDKVAQWNATVDLEQILLHGDCSHPREFMEFLLETFPITEERKLTLKQVYPQNHMRNIARKSCGTEWTFSTDIDIIPREGMAEMLQQFYESMSPCEKCAFVIPTFELDETKRFPRTKQEMVEYFNTRASRQFHCKIFAPGHKATTYGLWARTNVEDGPVKISHPILSSGTYLYEPFYVSPDTIPPFDERFLGYGFTRNSQFQEALYAGWNFTVLTPVFSVHWGLQSSKTLLSPMKESKGKTIRLEQTAANHKLFQKILKEMKLKKLEGIF